MFFVVGPLHRAPALGFVQGAADGIGHDIGIENGAATQVAGGASNGLNERARRAQEAFLVGIQDRDQGNLGQIEPFAQKVDADQHVIFSPAQIAQQAHPLQGLDLGVHVAAFDPDLRVVARPGLPPFAWLAR